MRDASNTGSVLLPGQPRTVQAVIFDMDGTLIESTQADYEAWRQLFAEYNRALTFEEYFPLIGMKSAVMVQRVLQLNETEAAIALRKKLHYFKEYVLQNGLRTVPFAVQLLERLHTSSVKLGLATSSRGSKTAMVLSTLGLSPYFDVIVNGDHVKKSKPSPDIFLHAAEMLAVAPGHCVVVEDAANGVTAAKKAGMKCIAITTTHSREQLRSADLVIDSYEQLDIDGLERLWLE